MRRLALLIGFLFLASPALASNQRRHHRRPARQAHSRKHPARGRRPARKRHYPKRHRRAHSKRHRHTRTSAAPPALASGAPAGPAALPVAGKPNYRLDARGYFNPFARDTAWLREHVATIEGYPPFSDRYVASGVPVIGYHDPATEGYAPLTPAKIKAVVAKALLDKAHGYAGVFIDDVNWGSGYRDGSQSKSIEPEAHEEADLLEAIRSAWPSAEIEMNSQWHDLKANMSNANVQRGLAAASVVTKEFGVGPTAGVGAGDYRELLQFDESLHARGKHMVFTGDRNSNNVATMEWNLATMLLVNDGGDAVDGSEQTPTSWWPGFNVDLGYALGPAERQAAGLWVRRFAAGVVYTVEPGSGTQTVSLGQTMHSAEWGTVSSITLSAGQGAVLAQP